jgi:diguanylate cyclase (GGDEF)-like protein/PAS domain S-box-containing protein
MHRALKLARTCLMAPARAIDRSQPTPLRLWALAGFVALYASWQLVDWIPVRRELAGDLLLLAICLGAAGGASGAARRASSSPRLRGAWMWVAVALLAQAFGEIAQLVYELSGSSAYPTWADPLYLSFYPLLLIGVLRFPSVRLPRRDAIELALDCAIVTFGVGAVFVYLILGPQVVAARTALETVVSVAYPLGDMILLVALGSVVLRGRGSETAPALRTIAVAIALFAIADLAFGYIALHGVYHGGDPIDTLYMLAFAAFVVAASRQARPDPTPVESTPRPTAGRVRENWLPSLGIAAAVAIIVAKEWSQPFFPDMSIAIIAAMVAVLVMARQILAQTSIRESHARLAQAQEIAQVGSWEWDVERDLYVRSQIDLKLYGLDPDTPPMTLAEALAPIHPDDRERVDELVAEAVSKGDHFTCEFRIVRSDGEIRTLLTRGEVQSHGGHAALIRGTHQDTTERKQMETRLQYQADHDPLTGLFNRRRFNEELEGVLQRSARYGRPGALLMLDLDDFKMINDTRGHAAGDQALQALAQAIRDRVRAGDVVARIGGDEFAVILPEAQEQDALVVVEDIRASVAARYTEMAIHITGGLVAFDGRSELSAANALIAADIALYEAKEAGKDRVQLYHGGATSAMLWVERIRTALQEGRFVLFAQPILDLQSGEVCHSELLLRMISESGEVIAPGAFLPTAERYGLINEIDRWVTREGLSHAAAGERVSINLSAQSIGDPCILDALRSAIADGVAPADVIFEITETAAMRNMDEARAFTQAIIDLGCEVALDDFGTGFGSFTYLKHLPARYLKIDMEFVREMVVNATDREVVDSITKVAHSLGKLTIAEGVEDAATLQALREYGVDRAQGFFIGRPRRLPPCLSAEGAPEAPAARADRRLAEIGG